jgi:hypothetical protein
MVARGGCLLGLTIVLVMVFGLAGGRAAHDETGTQVPSVSTQELTVGSGESRTLFAWTLRVAPADGTTRLDAAPRGSTWSLDASLTIDLSRYDRSMGRFKRLIVAVFAEPRFGADGLYRAATSDDAMSSTFTTTGVPIDTSDHWPGIRLIDGKNGSPIEGIVRFALPEGDLAKEHRFQGRIDVVVPSDVEEGYWQPLVAVLVEVEGVRDPVFINQFLWPANRHLSPSLPLVVVGDPLPPRMPWTLFPFARYWGRVGALPEEFRDRAGLVVRNAFPGDLIVPPGLHPVGPGLPTVFPRSAVPSLSGSSETFPAGRFGVFALDGGEVSCSFDGPGGHVDLGTRKTAGAMLEGAAETFGLALAGGPMIADLRRTGTYRFRLSGFLRDPLGRRYEGGGTYVVHAAKPLSFSTSCKPGTSFLVGDRYPPKVNVNPPVPAVVEVRVDYFPRSDPSRRRTWSTRGPANGFGHFAPDRSPLLVFDEPGEFLSVVTAEYVDPQGDLWMGQQATSGVVAPVEPSIVRLHGGQATREGRYPTMGPPPRQTIDDRFYHAPASALLDCTPFPLNREPTLPYDDTDTLFIWSRGYANRYLEPRFSLAVGDPRIARLLRDASTVPSRVLPRRYQERGQRWTYVSDILERGMEPFTWDWSPAPPDLGVELPITSVARGGQHPVNFPSGNAIDAYVYLGAVRPGLPVLVGVQQKEGFASLWNTNPNPFANQINAGVTGDLPGDIYRVQAGVVLKDHETGINYYDVYGSTIAFVRGSQPASAVLPPGAYPLVEDGERTHSLFLALDTHDCLEVGERVVAGGMVFPNVPADVTWTVTGPDGDVTVIRGRADRLGVVRGDRTVPVDRPGVYRIHVQVEHEGLVGGIVGTRDDTYWVGAVERDRPGILRTTLPPSCRIDPEGEVRVDLVWPDDLRDVKIHYAAVMPGRVIEDGELRPQGPGWTYRFWPMEAPVRVPNYDAVDLFSGEPAPGETVVFLFHIEAERASSRVNDALRFVLRGDELLGPQPTGSAASVSGHGEHPAVPKCPGATDG